jgi:DNA-binding response OmpR family regulator
MGNGKRVKNTILIADGNRNLPGPFLKALDIAGYRVHSARKDADILLLASATSPDVILVVLNDYNHDIELLRRLAAISEDMECILVGNNIDIDTLADLYNCGNVYGHRHIPSGNCADIMRDIARAAERRLLRMQNSYLLSRLRDSLEVNRSMSAQLYAAERRMETGKIIERAMPGLYDILTDLSKSISACGTEHFLLDELWRRLEPLKERASDPHNLKLNPDMRAIINIHALLDGALGILGDILTSRNIHIKKTYAQVPPLMYLDAGSISQAFICLSLRAIRSVPRGGRLVVMTRTRRGSKEGVQIILKGIGSPMASMKGHLRLENYEYDDMNESELQIARAIFEEHGAHMEFRSGKGYGGEWKVDFDGVCDISPENELLMMAA